MFRLGHYLQVLLALAFLSGCASSQNINKNGEDKNKAATQEKTIKQAVINKQIDSSRTYPNNIFGDFVDEHYNLIPEVQIFAITTAQENNLNIKNLEALLKSANFEQTAARLMTPPAHKRRIKRAWQSYKNRHVDPIRTKKGIAFWHANKAKLDEISKASGIPQSIIVAIIGIETVYGQYMGNHRVLDTLTTLGFKYPDPNRPERQAMFRSQLADLLILHEQGKLNANTAQGSFAGAMGLAQFMPTSLLRYAADGDNDGRIDLHDSPDDAIASIASFLLLHGWEPNAPVFASAQLSESAKNKAQDSLQPETNWDALKNHGVQAKNPSNSFSTNWQNLPLGVIDLQDEIRNTHEYRLATPNFFAITNYNRSYFYATSVADLAYEIANNMGYGYPY